MSRDQMIEWLIDNDLDTGDKDWLALILEYGFSGYRNWETEDLHQEILERDHTGEIIPLTEAAS